MAEFADEHIDLLTAVYDLAHRIEESRDPAEIAEYVDQLSRLKAKLFALGTAKEAAGQS
ncbi:MAG: hypothetical protein WA188_07920 [Terriglobales bacterium]